MLNDVIVSIKLEYLKLYNCVQIICIKKEFLISTIEKIYEGH